MVGHHTDSLLLPRRHRRLLPAGAIVQGQFDNTSDIGGSKRFGENVIAAPPDEFLPQIGIGDTRHQDYTGALF